VEAYRGYMESSRDERHLGAHPTGGPAFVILTQILGPSVAQPCPVGTVLEL
jgi:hypothetical protein